MKELSRRICAMLLVMAAVCSVCVGTVSQAKTVRNVNQNAADDTKEGVMLAVVAEDGSIQSPLSISRSVGNGRVIGDGVKLRKSASSSGTVLELMYSGEVVVIDYSKSKISSGWYYLTRSKTSTKGYASTKYIVAV